MGFTLVTPHLSSAPGIRISGMTSRRIWASSPRVTGAGAGSRARSTWKSASPSQRSQSDDDRRCDGDEASTAAGATPAGADFDRAFIDAMVPHHESAIEMAIVAKEAGLRVPELVELADAVIATQQREIDQMEEWRGEWFGSSEIDPMGADALGMDEDQMGMSHDSEALRTSGDVDMDFAQMMLTHHEGAIAMARLADGSAERDEIKDLAGSIVAAQGGRDRGVARACEREHEPLSAA